MLVRMMTTAAGPQGIWPAGSVQDVAQETAAALAAGRYAVALDAAPPVVALAPRKAKNKGKETRENPTGDGAVRRTANPG